MFLFNNPIICILFIGVIMSIPTFYCIHVINKLQSTISNQSFTILQLMKKLTESNELLFYLNQNETKNMNNLSSLTSSIQIQLEEQKKQSEHTIYPTPQLSEMIGVTIKEQIATEEVLSSHMRMPKAESTKKIIDVVIATYPHVNKEYLVKRCMAQIEAHVQNVKSGTEQQG